MPGVGITLGEELQAEIDDLRKRNMGQLEVPSGNEIPSRSEAVRLLCRLGLAALSEWDQLPNQMSIRNMEHHTRMAVNAYLEKSPD